MNVTLNCKKVLSILASYLAQYLKSLMAIRGDFLGWLIASVTYEATLLSFVVILFYNTPDIAGWTIFEILLVRGLFKISDGLYYNLFNGFIYNFAGRYLVEGEMDRILSRPFNPFFQIMGENLGIHEFIDVITGIVYVSSAFIQLRISFTLHTFATITVAVFSGVLILGGITTIIICLQFYIQSRGSLVEIFNNFSEFAIYPIPIYHKILRFVLTFVIPLGFIAYFPGAYILEKSIQHQYILLAPILGVGIFAVGYLLFNFSVKYYRGTGT